MNEKVDILGVKINRENWNEVLGRVEEMESDNLQHYIVTPNPEFVMAARQDDEFANILNEADLAVADGIGLIWAAKLLYGSQGKLSRVSGVDLMQRICFLASKNNWSIFLLGAEAGVAEKCAENLQNKWPLLKVVGTLAGKGGEEHDQETIKQIREKIGNRKVDFIFVAYGGIKQEKWIKRNLSKLPIRIAMGVGGSFDFISGRIKRAPHWIRKMGLEWSWRLIKEPWRWRRQLVLPKFVLTVLKKKLLLFFLNTQQP